MSAPATIKFDSSSGFALPEQDGPRKAIYPFLVNGDRTALIYRRDLVVREAFYVPPVLGRARDSEWPGGDPHAYALNDPDELTYVGIGDLIRIPRRYARIPGDQISYPGRTYIAKPDYAPDSSVTPVNPYGASGGALNRGPVSNYSPYSLTGGTAYYSTVTGGGIYDDFTNKLFGPPKTLTGHTVGYATAGTFTITYGANTTAALNYDASMSSIQTAINGLASIISEGITASVGYAGLNVSYGGVISVVLQKAGGAAPASTLILDATGLTVNTSKNPITITNSAGNAAQQTMALPTHVTSTAHGLSTSLELAAIISFNGASTYSTSLFASGQWGSIDANTLWIPNQPIGQLNPYSVAATFSTTVTPPEAPAAASYVGGLRFPRVRLTEKFYLPGVTPGITTAADIPVPSDLQNPDDFLDELLTSPAGYEVYRVEGPALWLGGPIYRVAIEELYFPDLV